MKKYLVLLFLLCGCSIAPDDEILYLYVDDSYLPIYVRGNASADTYIIWVHGGPGSSGLYYGCMPEVALLHSKYRVIYWDQLSSGGSTGSPSQSAFTISNFSEHTRGIVNIIKNRYNPPNLFLLGHSWGGMLSAYYLIAHGDTTESQSRQSMINGLITLNGVWDIQDALTNGTEFMTNYAQTQIDNNNDKSFWQDVLSWYKSKNGVYIGADVAEHFDYINDAGGMVVNKARVEYLTKILTTEMLLNSPFEFYSYYDNQKSIRTYLDIAECSLVNEDKYNVSMINIPTLMMAGESDRIAFLSSVVKWHELLSTGKNSANYPIKTYENSAHAAFIDSTDEYIQDIHDFINAHKN